MYVYAMCFILSHEYAHAKYNLYNGTKKDEEKADSIAVKLLITGSQNNNELGNRAIAGLLGLGAIMLLSKFLQSNSHPDIDKRIYDYINNIGINDDNNEIWALACIIYAYWDHEYDIKLNFFHDNLSLTYKERFDSLFNQ